MVGRMVQSMASANSPTWPESGGSMVVYVYVPALGVLRSADFGGSPYALGVLTALTYLTPITSVHTIKNAA